MKRAVSILIRVLFTGLILGIGFISFWAWTYSRDLPNLNTLEGLKFRAGSPQPLHWSVPSSTNAIFDSKPVPLENIAPLALSAIVSSEDRRFYDHAGFDLVGLGRSLFETALGHQQGGSTITAQLVRSTILKPQKNLKRKVQELWLSNQLEQRLSKAEILTGYIYTVYWGGQLYGIRAAAKAYFAKSPETLTLAESIYLAALLPAPNTRYQNFQMVRDHDFKSRLERLVQDRRITKQVAHQAWLEPLQPKGWHVHYDAQGRLISAVFIDPTNSLKPSKTR